MTEEDRKDRKEMPDEPGDESVRSDPFADSEGEGPDRENIVMEDLPEENEALIDRVEDSPLDSVLVDMDDNQVEPYLLDPEMVEDSEYIGTDDDIIVDEIEQYTSDLDVLEDFEERQQTNAGSDQMLNKLSKHHSRTPQASADDLDADWESQYQSGEETVGGTTPTPDQDRVDDLGEAVGLEYEDDEPLQTYNKIAGRDEERFELTPESMEEYQEELSGLNSSEEEHEEEVEDKLADLGYDKQDVEDELGDLGYSEEEIEEELAGLGNSEEDIEDELVGLGYSIDEEDVLDLDFPEEDAEERGEEDL